MRDPRHVSLLAAVAMTAGLSAGQTGSVSPPAPAAPIFKVQVDYVEVDTLVTDRDGAFVRGLQKEDFKILEDGKPQTISAFSVVDIPVERAQRPLGAAQPIEPDVKTNARPFDGRVYVMLIDDLHTQPGRTPLVKRAASQFIQNNFGANDLMAVVHTSGRADSAQDFTSNKRLLLAAVDKTIGEKIDKPNGPGFGGGGGGGGRGSRRSAGAPNADPTDMERGTRTIQTLDQLKEIAEWFSSVHGRRKSILFVSEGFDYDINNVFANSAASWILDETRSVVAAATRSNVSLYGIDPRGLTSLADEDITRSGPSRGLRDDLLLSQNSLRTLSDETGGFAVVNRNDFSTAFDRIVQDNSSYYVLAYYPPPSDKGDGRFHQIKVELGRPGLVARARTGYVSPKGKPSSAPAVGASAKGASPELRDALSSPLPVSGLTLQVTAAPFKGAAPNASVLLCAELGRDLRVDVSNQLELSYVAVDAKGKVRAVDTDRVTLPPQTQPKTAQTGIRLLKRLALSPGRYLLHVAAHDSTGGAVGSVLYDLDVPDFASAPLTMSGIVITSPTGAAVPTARPDAQLQAVFPGPASALRAFPQGDEISVFAEVYDNAASQPHKVDMATIVTSDTAAVVYTNREERESSELQGKRGGFGYISRVPLKDLAPGAYVLKVEARSRLGPEAMVSREVPFTILGALPARSDR